MTIYDYLLEHPENDNEKEFGIKQNLYKESRNKKEDKNE